MSKLGKVGPYALLERLGRGGMGEVYLASSRRGERVALKVLHELTQDDSSRIRLEREVRALRRVESPYVAKVLDADLDCDRPYLVMENIEGVTLLDLVRQDGPLDLPRLVQLAQGIAAALAIIHAAGVVHRDLKPANIIMGADGPVLIDFGIAQVLDATRLTMTGTFLGTPGYTAPEIFADEQVDSPADIHAWAATVAFAATGRPAFGRGTAEAQMYAVLNGQADLKGVPVALLPLVRAALNREPAKRPTAALLADRLSRLAKATGVPDVTASPAGLLAAPVAEDARDRPGEARGRAGEARGRPGEARGRGGEDAKLPAPRKAPPEDGRGSGPRPRPGGDALTRGRSAAEGAVRGRSGGDTDPRGRAADPAARGRIAGGADGPVRGRGAGGGADGAMRGRGAGAGGSEAAARGRATGPGTAEGPARVRGAGAGGAEGAAPGRVAGAGGADGAGRGRGAGAGGADGPARGRGAGVEGRGRETGAEGTGRGRGAAGTDGAGRGRAMGGGDTDPRGRTTGADGGARRQGGEGEVPAPRSRAAADVTRGRSGGENVRGRTSAESARSRAVTEPGRGRATGEGARARSAVDGARVRSGVEGARARSAAEGVAVPAPRGRTDARARARAVEGAARVRARAAAARARGGRATGKGAEQGAGGLPAGSAALLLLAVLAVPCVVASVMWPIASIGITTVFVVLTRTIWTSHWLVRKRPSRRWRIALRVLLFPFALTGSAASAVVWPGVPVAVAAGGALWLTGGGEIHSDWWQQPAPVTAAGVVFGMLCGGITGREIERVGARLPELRREGLRALAVLGGFVALCAAAVRAIALLL
ncbi:protein kinase domain-containing protein [Nonomuraea indica]|uniref:Protein kinase n=1 Tax=Nonomuraea indica TaxID=1581193 RepID=A0ABW8A196_9ACTN